MTEPAPKKVKVIVTFEVTVYPYEDGTAKEMAESIVQEQVDRMSQSSVTSIKMESSIVNKTLKGHCSMCGKDTYDYSNPLEDTIKFLGYTPHDLDCFGECYECMIYAELNMMKYDTELGIY